VKYHLVVWISNRIPSPGSGTVHVGSLTGGGRLPKSNGGGRMVGSRRSEIVVEAMAEACLTARQDKSEHETEMWVLVIRWYQWKGHRSTDKR